MEQCRCFDKENGETVATSSPKSKPVVSVRNQQVTGSIPVPSTTPRLRRATQGSLSRPENLHRADSAESKRHSLQVAKHYQISCLCPL
jgi:hypothetical protein